MRGRVKGRDARLLEVGVHFGDAARRAAGAGVLGFTLDELDGGLRERHGRDVKGLVVVGLGVGGEVVEDRPDAGGDGGV